MSFEVLVLNLTNGSRANATAEIGEPWGTSTVVILGGILILIMLSAVFGNLMVISVVLRHKGMRTKTNMFLLNLAIADFLVGLTMVPFSTITLFSKGWILGETLCTINGMFNAVFFIVSIQTLMCISIQKFYSIQYPLGDWFTRTKIYVLICIIWIWAVTFSVLTVHFLSHVSYKPNTLQCGPDYPDYGEVRLVIHHVITQVVNIFLPFGITIVTQAKLFLAIRGHTKRLRKNSTMEVDSILSQQKRVTITVAIVVIVFIGCWIPYHVYAMTSTQMKGGTPFLANAVAYTFGYLNSSCNPIIYGFRSHGFRAGYQEILCQTPKYAICDGPMGRSYVRTISGDNRKKTKEKARKNSEKIALTRRGSSPAANI